MASEKDQLASTRTQAPLKKRVVSALGTRAFLAIQRWLTKKSPVDAENSGAKLGALAYKVSSKHRMKADRNLRLAFPELSDPQRETLARDVLIHFGRVMAVFVRLGKLSDKEILDMVEFEGFEHLEGVMKAGRGAVITSGHFGNWEILGTVLAIKGIPISVVAREANDPALTKLVTDLRESHGMKIIPRGDAARPILRELKEGHAVGLIPDQNSSEIYVPFFGHPCGTVMGPAIISIRSRAPIIPVYCARIGPTRYKVIVEPPLNPVEGYSLEEGLTRAMNLSLESVIRKYPDQYLWIHDRWKSARREGLVP